MGELISQGAEGKIYKDTFLGKLVVVKERFSKAYRIPFLDLQLNNHRLKSEVRCLLKCKTAGIKTPAIYFIDHHSRKIYMEYVENSCTVKDFINLECQSGLENYETKLQNLAKNLGHVISLMHQENIVHGDLTTSNFLINKSTHQLTIIDFGLGQIESVPEDKAVDLYVLERALSSTHPSSVLLFDAILRSYIECSGHGSKEVIKKLEEVRLRGRKRTMVG